jgi:UDP-N-acetylglucosamine 4,6-dehydratase
MAKLLITGGTGSFGNAVVRRYLKTDIEEIRIFSRDEKKQEDMRTAICDSRVNFYIGDVRDAGSLVSPMRGVDYVFHSAALKQVPSCEFFPIEAVKTNVLGAENVFNAAINAGVKKVVALSTDKAVYPINAMGQSKALMEKLMTAKARSQKDTLFTCTRYGNVLASRGSVVPLFIEQIKSGKALTVTNPAMTRFLMTIDEAVDLVTYAFEHAKSGDIFIKKSPAATIETIAAALRNIFQATNEVSLIGTRHGEKLYETLVTAAEMTKAEDLPDHYRIQADARDLNYPLYFSEGQTITGEDYTSDNTRRLSVSETEVLLNKIM